jgi:hypothetical protein
MEGTLSGPLRWVTFFAVIVLAGAGVTALWVGLTPELVKAVTTFAIIALAGLALWAVTGKR